VVPRRRRGIVPDGIVQTRIQNFVRTFPNLGVMGVMGVCKLTVENEQVITASCHAVLGVISNSGKKRRYCELGNRETGGQPSKAHKLNLLPGINKH
jgi:hypothetical protein